MCFLRAVLAGTETSTGQGGCGHKRSQVQPATEGTARRASLDFLQDMGQVLSVAWAVSCPVQGLTAEAGSGRWGSVDQASGHVWCCVWAA